MKPVYFEKLYPLDIKKLAKSVRLIREDNAQALVQDEAKASFQPVITSKDTVIDWSQSTGQIYDLIRGANPSPGAVTSLRGEPYKLFDAAPGGKNGSPGMVPKIDQNSFSIATGDGSITVYSAQISGQKKQPAVAFAQQIQLKTGDQFGS